MKWLWTKIKKKELIPDFFRKKISLNSRRILKHKTKTPHQTAINWFGTLTVRQKLCL